MKKTILILAAFTCIEASASIDKMHEAKLQKLSKDAGKGEEIDFRRLIYKPRAELSKVHFPQHPESDFSAGYDQDAFQWCSDDASTTETDCMSAEELKDLKNTMAE